MLNPQNVPKSTPLPEVAWTKLPQDIWIEIASYLSPQELENFKIACKTFFAIGQADKILIPVYNQLYARLCRLDPNLPEMLPKENYQQQYQGYLNKVAASIESEITYLRKYHSDSVKAHVDTLSLANQGKLQRLEKLSNGLDDVNIDIIKPLIDLNSYTLDLSHKKITRLPENLIEDSAYLDYWKNLKILYCDENRLTLLNIQRLNSLESLDCDSNQLTALNLQGLNKLQWVDCDNNKLTTLNVQGLNALQCLYCDNNQLTVLNVQGLNALRSLDLNNNQITDLNIQGLNALENLQCVNNFLTSLNVQGLNILQFLYCDKNKLTGLPPEAIAKFGAEWATETLVSQKPAAIPEPIVPLYQQNNPASSKRKISTRESEQVQKEAENFLKPKIKKSRLN